MTLKSDNQTAKMNPMYQLKGSWQRLRSFNIINGHIPTEISKEAGLVFVVSLKCGNDYEVDAKTPFFQRVK